MNKLHTKKVYTFSRCKDTAFLSNMQEICKKIARNRIRLGISISYASVIKGETKKYNMQ